MISLLTLLDDIATTLDDVAVMTKVAMKKTSALMSDDLAVNAGVVHGVNPDRELPIVKAIFVGSLLNKVYCIVGVIAIMAIYPPVLKIILLLGGIYLSYEGAHKIVEKLFHPKALQHPKKVITEKMRIKGAIRTDLILSAEILVIAKSALKGSMLTQIFTLVVIGVAVSILIYGMVALLVKIDDLGLYLITKGHEKTGNVLVQSMPYMMKGLGLVGTLAMFLVGGGIIAHTFHIPNYIPELLQHLILGLVAGVMCLPIVHGISKLFNR